MQELPNDIEGLVVPAGLPWRMILIAAGVAALLGFCVYLWRRWRRAKAMPTTAVRVLTRREQMDLALKELADLRTSVSKADGNMLSSAIAISSVVKKMAEWNGLLQAPFLTTEELATRWHVAPPFSAQDKTFVIDFNATLDRVKFAGQSVDVVVIAQHIQSLEAMLQRQYDAEVKREDAAHA